MKTTSTNRIVTGILCLGAITALGALTSGWSPRTARAAPAGPVETLVVNDAFKQAVPVKNVRLPVPVNQVGLLSAIGPTQSQTTIRLPNPPEFFSSVIQTEHVSVMVGLSIFDPSITPTLYCIVSVMGGDHPDHPIQLVLTRRGSFNWEFRGTLPLRLTLAAGAELLVGCDSDTPGAWLGSVSVAGRVEGF